MSTNYYARPVLNFPLNFTVNSYDDLEELTVKIKELSKCNIHLGKKSYGWKFLGSWNNGTYYSDYASYLKFIECSQWEIYDEYNNPITKEEFIKIISSEQEKDKRHCTYEDKYIHFPKLDFLNGDWC